MSAPESPQYRAELDFEIIFANGGSLRGESFRIDVDRPDLADDELASALIRDLGLLMVDELRIDRREVFPEPHKRPPAPSANATSARLRHADLSHVITEGMVTIPGFPVPRAPASGSPPCRPRSGGSARSRSERSPPGPRSRPVTSHQDGYRRIPLAYPRSSGVLLPLTAQFRAARAG